MVAQILWSHLILVPVKITGHGPKRLRILLSDAFRRNRCLFGPGMALQREGLPHQPHVSLVSRVDQRLDFIKGLGAIRTLEVGKLYYHYRSIAGAEGRAVIEMQQLQVGSLPRVGDTERREALRQNSSVTR